MRIAMRRVLVLVPVFAATLTLSAQEPRLLEKDTFMEMEAVANPAISPDGSRVVFAREWIDQMKDQRRSNLWVARTDGSRVRELTTGAWRDSAPVWSPDGTRIAYMKDEFEKFTYADAATKGLYIYDLKTGKTRQHVNDKLLHLYTLNWSPDGKWFVATVHGGRSRSSARSPTRIPS